MSSYAEQHLIYKVANAEVELYPYPHFFVERVFPADFYARMREHFPQAADMPQLKSVRPVGSGYPEQRLCIPLDLESVEKLPSKQRLLGRNCAMAARQPVLQHPDGEVSAVSQ